MNLLVFKLVKMLKRRIPNAGMLLSNLIDYESTNRRPFAFPGYLWKDKSEDGVRKILEDQVIPLDRLLVETDAPFMYPNTRASKLPQHVKDALTEK